MGMWQGLLQGKMAVDEAKRQERLLELQEKQFTEEQRNKRLSVLMEYQKSSRSTSKRAESTASTIKELNALGITGAVADYLTQSGEASLILRAVEKGLDAGNLSPSYIPSVIAKTRKVLGDSSSPQALAIATKAALLSGEDMSTYEGQQAALVEALYAAQTMEDFAKVDEDLLKMVQTPQVTGEDVLVPSVGVATMPSKEVDSAEYTKVRNIVIERLAPSFGATYFKNEQGNFMVDPTKLKGDVGAAELEDIISTTTAAVLSDSGTVPFVESLDYQVNVALKKKDDLGKINPPPVEVPKTPSAGLGTGVDIFTEQNEEEDKDPFEDILGER